MLGADALNTPGRIRYHTDDSIQIKYYDNSERFLDKSRVLAHRRHGMRARGGRQLRWYSAKGPSRASLAT